MQLQEDILDSAQDDCRGAERGQRFDVPVSNHRSTAWTVKNAVMQCPEEQDVGMAHRKGHQSTERSALSPIQRQMETRTLDLLGICGTSVVRVDLLCRRTLVEGDESVEEVVARCVVVITTGVVGEVVA